KKANKAIKTIKEFLVKHMKIYDRDLKKIKVDKFLNEFVWFRGIRNPPHKVKVKAIKEGEIVRVELAEMPDKLKFKKVREEKRDKKALEIVEKKKTMMQKAKEQMQKPTEKKSEEKSEEKKEENEKKSAVVEEGKKIEKTKAKEMKHIAKAKSPKQEKNAIQSEVSQLKNEPFYKLE
ncbi:MAG: hypothetical protein P8X70_01780, partial [Nanoarchaeota archaeon]